jgi:antibiotic biosynthesis monooxygenase (ABM) superfamily enzyme
MRFKEENKQALLDALISHPMDTPGFVDAEVLITGESGELILAVRFEDKDSYTKNADSPEQHERYLKFRALLESDPEWSDGEWIARF